MKKISFIICIFLYVIANAQITLEHTYDSSSTIVSLGPSGAEQSQLMLINFEVTGEQYVRINRWGKTICIYNMNHILQKTIPFSTFPMDFNNKSGDFLYFSEKLFDTDSGMEFMYGVKTSAGPYYTGIYNDDGSVIFSDTGAAIVRPNWLMQQYPIYNSSQGTKMILSYENKQTKVFSLPGTLTTGIQNGNEQLIQAQGGSISNVYPNPTTGAVTLQYELPKGGSSGEIVLYNQQGAEVKRYTVDDTFKELLLDNTMLPAGTYFYQLQTSKGAVGTKKMVVIK